MEGMRTLLIVVGLIVILALLGHGLWTIRKNNQQGKAKRGGYQPQQRVDESGFDEYGIGPVRTVKNKAEIEQSQSRKSTISEQAAEQPAVKKSAAKTVQQPALFSEEEAPVLSHSGRGNARKEPSVSIEQLPMAFDESDSNNEPNISSTDISGADNEPTPEIGEVEPEQEAENSSLLTAGLDKEQQDKAMTVQSKEELSKHEPVVITLYVSGDIQGAILLQTVTELGFKFGDMDIFHRHEDTTGKGPSLFSLANMYNPGVFNLDEIETFNTRGVALFMELPVPSDGHKAFTMMYNAANKIAEAMPRAAVLDGNRNPITKQSVQHTYQKIREFERRQHVADAARH